MKMIKNRKFSKFLVSIFLPVVVFLSIGFFSFGAISTALAIPEPEDPVVAGGGAFYIGKNSTFTMTTGTISGFSTNTFGGGVYVASGGTFNMSGGSIYGNTAAIDGSQICSYGTFTMIGGTIGKNGTTASESGIYNKGEMNLYGGTIYEGILSSYASFSTKMACNIQGTITLQNGATITVEDYAGTTPSYTIVIDSTRETGTIVTFKGSSTEPDVSKLSITGYDASKYVVKAVKDSSGNWTAALVNNSVDFPSDWKTQVASSTYMTTTITPANLTSIKFVASVPSGYTQIGTLSTGLPVYQGTTATEIAFVYEKIYAPENCLYLFGSLRNLEILEFHNFNTTNATSMSGMFIHCSSLTSLDLSIFNTSNVINMNEMFSGCSSLTSLDVSNFDTSKVRFMGIMFQTCSKLTSLDVSNFNTSNVTNMGHMFNQCSKLTSLDVSNFNTSKVTNMSNMFSSCSSLTSLNLSNFNTLNVTDMHYMFSSCSSLTSLDLSNFSTSKVTGMGYMFSSCSTLTSLDLGNFSTSNVTDMSYMFYNCSRLTSLNVSGFNTTKVTDMNNMFGYCRALTSLDVSGFNTSYVTNMKRMFLYCSALKSLDVSNFNTSNVTDMSYMFRNCSALTTLDLSSFNMAKVTDSANMLNFGTSNKIQTLKTPYNNSSAIAITTGSTLYNEDTGAVVTTVPAGTTKSLTYVNENPEKELPTDWKTQLNSSTYMTSTRSTVTGIRFESTVPTGLVQIGKLSTGLKVYANGNNIAFINKKTIYAPADSSYLFANNASLTSISFTNFNTSKATTMARMFSGASGLTTIDVTSFNTSIVTSMTYMFNACTKLETIKIAGIDTSNVTTMASMFAHCTALSSLNLAGFNTAKVTNMSIMFGYLTNLSKLDLSMFNTANVTTMQQMFYQSTGIKVLNLSSFNMSKTTTTTNMLNFGSSGNLGRIQTPYNNKSALAITTSGTLYNTSTGSSVTGVSANTSTSQTFAKKVTVTFNAYGGTTPSISTYTKYYGATFGSSYPSTSRADYTFQGWYTEISGGSSIDYYVLVGDTTFYAHWSSNTGGGGSGGGGTDPEPTPTLPSSFERRHGASELDGETLDGQSIFDILDIFNSESSNTFTAADVTKFAIVSGETYNDYQVEQQLGTVGNMEVAVLSYVGSDYDSLLGGDQWILGIMNNSGTIGFDQWYYFDSMFFMKLSEILPYLVTLDLRGLDTSLTTFSFRLPDTVENVIINDSNAPLLSHRVVNFVTMGQGTISSTGFGGAGFNGEGVIGDLNLNTVLRGYISESEMGEIKGFAVFSTKSPEQYADYIFQHEYGQIAPGVYLCLVRVTDDFTSKFSGVSTDDVFLAFVSYTSPIYFTDNFSAAGGFGNYIEIGGSIYYADFRGLAVVFNDNVPTMARDFEVNFSQEIILPEDYDNGMLQFETSSTLINHDGSTRNFISGNNNGSSGNLEIARTKFYNVTAEDVDLYIEDKKWFDPKKNKIKLKTQISGEEE